MHYLDREKLVKNLEIRMKANMDANIIGNASLWVWQDGEAVYRNHFGPDASEKAIYRLASMTKPITAVAVLQQIEAGKLALTDTVDKFYPEFRETPMVSVENGELVKLHHFDEFDNITAYDIVWEGSVGSYASLDDAAKALHRTPWQENPEGGK